MVVIGFGLAIFAIGQLRGSGRRVSGADLRASMWVWPWLVGTSVISYLGQFGGGQDVIPFWWDIVVVIAFSVATYALAVRLRLDPRTSLDYLEEPGPSTLLTPAVAVGG